MSKPTYINARNVIAKTQFVSQGNMHISGTITCTHGTVITIGDQRILSTPDGIAAYIGNDSDAKIIIGKKGICIGGGFYFRSTPSVIVTGISNDSTFSSARDDHLVTAAAVKGYIDNRLLSASYDSVSANTIAAQDASGITFDGETVFDGPVTMNGSVQYSTARITAGEKARAHTISTSFIFVTCAINGGVIDVNGDVGIVGQFINTGMNITGDSALLRFDCGCAWLDGAMKFMRLSSHQWSCFSVPDALFPTRVSTDANISYQSVATSIATDANGYMIAIGNATDAGERGCVHIFYRTGSSWSQACPKIVGTCATPAVRAAGKHQGLHCAINATATVFAFANEHEFWVFAIDSAAQQFYKIATREVAHIVAPFAHDIMSLCVGSRGNMIIVAGDSDAAIYDYSGANSAKSWNLRYSSQLFRAPIGLSGNGAVCYALSHDGASIVRADMSAPGENIAIVAPIGNPELPITDICCDMTGANWLSNTAASAFLSTCITIADDKRTIIVAHNGLEHMRATMSHDIMSYAISNDGAMALVRLSSGTIKIIF